MAPKHIPRKAAYYFLAIIIMATPPSLGLLNIMHLSRASIFSGRILPWSITIVVLGIACFISYCVWVLKLNILMFKRGEERITTLDLLFDQQKTARGEQYRKWALISCTLFFLLVTIYFSLMLVEVQQFLVGK